MLVPETDRQEAIDLFCGAGGLSLGLQRAGFDLVAAVENDPSAALTYRHNFGDHLLEGSITELSATELLEFAGLEAGQCALLAGGPPCQGFSVQRRGDDHDLRNHLILDFMRLVEGIKPRFFLIENVRGLMSRRGKPYYEAVLDHAQDLGYHVAVTKVNAANLGVPQERIRVFMVAELLECGSAPSFDFPKPLVSTAEYRTVREAIGDLPSPPSDGSPHAEYANHFREARLSPTNRERFRHIPEGGGRDDLPVHLQLPCHLNNPNHRHKDVYGRLWWDRPSVTITARFDSFSRGRFGHPEDHRSLTLREGARLQSFPDDFVFLGNREEVARQVGNAVPPLVAEAFGRSILECIRGEVAPKHNGHQLALFARNGGKR